MKIVSLNEGSKVVYVLHTIGRVVDKAIDYIVVSAVNIMLFSMTIAIFIAVVMRYAFGVAYGQIQEYCILLFVWIVFVMAGKIAREGKHITIGLLPERLVRAGRVKAKGAFDIYVSVALLVFGVMFVYFGILDTVDYYTSGYHSTLPYIPYYWTRHLALPVGSAMLIYHAIRKLIKDIHSFGELKQEGGIGTR